MPGLTLNGLNTLSSGCGREVALNERKRKGMKGMKTLKSWEETRKGHL